MPESFSQTGASQLDERSFRSTRWSVLRAAQGSAAERHTALEVLCRSYWMPVYGYVRRRGHSIPDAEDLAQTFFADLLEGDFFDQPDPAKGRFRGYLVGALKHFLSHDFEKRQTQKRGGGALFITWSEGLAEERWLAFDQPQLDPATAFDSAWILTLLDHALELLASEQRAARKEQAFMLLKPFLNDRPDPGEYDAVASTLGCTRANVSLLVHRLQQRYGEIVRMEVAATVNDPAEVKDEMEYLFQILRR